MTTVVGWFEAETVRQKLLLVEATEVRGATAHVAAHVVVKHPSHKPARGLRNKD